VTRPCCTEDVHLSPRGSVAGTQPSDLVTIHEEPEDKDVQKIAGSSLPGQDSDAVSQDWVGLSLIFVLIIAFKSQRVKAEEGSSLGSLSSRFSDALGLRGSEEEEDNPNSVLN
jgi:hypothetical protein